MAERDRPYSQFNFLVDFGDNKGSDPKGGFQEVSGLGMEITMAEYRNGNHKENSSIKMPGIYKVPDVTLKRGVFGRSDLYKWLDDVRKGTRGEPIRKKVTITLQNEDHSDIAQTWTLHEVIPIKYTGPSLNAKGNDVAVEELVLASERIDMGF